VAARRRGGSGGPLPGWAQLGSLIADGPASSSPGGGTFGEVLTSSLTVRDRRRPWRSTARPDQQLIADAVAFIRLVMAGRGWGKGHGITNALAEWATAEKGDYAAISPTLGDARKILTEGPSGLLVALGDDVADYNKSTLVITLKNGSRIVLASGERPDRLRGWNLRGAIIDELASFPVGLVRDLWDNALMPALRIGERPKLAIATTPRRSSPILRELVARAEDGDPAVLLIRGSTFDNAANLSDAFLEEMERRYAGTQTGRQELQGELLADVEGALVSSDLIEQTRIREEHVPDLARVGIGVDPATTSTSKSDHTGIIAAAIGPAPLEGYQGRRAVVDGPHLYLLGDYSLRGRPDVWAGRVLDASEEWDADFVTAEQNQGGDMVSTMIRMVAAAEQRQLPRIVPVWASRSKYIRAEPVAGVWQQNRIHVVGALPVLEDSWASWVPGDKASPDQLDASVHVAVGLIPQLGVKAQTEVKLLA
jgi:phage terminase large subunit-like protein